MINPIGSESVIYHASYVLWPGLPICLRVFVLHPKIRLLEPARHVEAADPGARGSLGGTLQGGGAKDLPGTSARNERAGVHAREP